MIIATDDSTNINDSATVVNPTNAAASTGAGKFPTTSHVLAAMLVGAVLLLFLIKHVLFKGVVVM